MHVVDITQVFIFASNVFQHVAAEIVQGVDDDGVDDGVDLAGMLVVGDAHKKAGTWPAVVVSADVS